MRLLCLDPGTTTGLAVLDVPSTGRPSIAAAWSEPFAVCLPTPWALAPGGEDPPVPYDALVIEDTRHQPIHAKRRRGQTAAALSKIARDVGRIDLMVDLLEDACRVAGRPVVLVQPTGPKWTSKMLAVYTGHLGRTNQHARDAIRCGWGVTRAHVSAARASTAYANSRP